MTKAEYDILIAKIVWDGSDAGLTQQSSLIKLYKQDRATTLPVGDVGLIDENIRVRLEVARDVLFQLFIVKEIERIRILQYIWAQHDLRKKQAAATIAANNGHWPVEDPGSGLYPRSGWLGKYVYEYCRSFESPDSFLFWSGVATLSAVIRRKVYVNFGITQLFPNFYILLVADAARARKGPPVKAAAKFARTIPSVNFIDRTTTERLPHDFAFRAGANNSNVSADAEGFLCAEELVAVLDNQTYNEGVMKFLLDWWDCPPTRSIRSFKHNIVTLNNIYPTMLAGTTPGLLVDGISQLIASGGMISRILCVCEERTTKVFPWPEIPDPQIEQNLITHLLHIDSRFGEFTLTPAARQWNDAWYVQFKKFFITAPIANAVAEERRQVHMIKLAMILALSENRPLELTEDLFMRADALLKVLYQSMPLLTETLQANTLGKDQLRVLNHIKNAPGGEISHSDLLRKNSPYGTSASILSEIIKTLIQRDEVEEFNKKSTNPKITKVAGWYRFTGGTP